MRAVRYGISLFVRCPCMAVYFVFNVAMLISCPEPAAATDLHFDGKSRTS